MEEYRVVFGKYEVSNLGNVRNSLTGRMLTPLKDKYGYYVVCLYEDGKRYSVKVHRLVAKAFVDNVENKPQIDHIDGNKENNAYTNLRWVTPKENSRNPITHARHVATIKPPMRKRTAVVCVETGTLYEGLRVAERHTNISHSEISACCKGKRRSAGGYRWRYA